MNEVDKTKLGWRRYFVAPCAIGGVLIIAGAYNGWETIGIIGIALFITCGAFLPTDLRAAKAKDR